MARTEYPDPEAEKAYKAIVDVSSKPSVVNPDDYAKERERTIDRDSAGSYRWPVTRGGK